jgi:hypothetical protein
LPKATCERCQRLTSDFERVCARFILGRFRVVHGLPTNHPRSRPTHFTIEIEKDGDIESVETPIQDYPAAPLFLLTWAKPGILRRARRSNTILQDVLFHFVMPVLRDIDERFARIGLSPGTYAYVPIGFEPVSFAQFIAKISHALAVAEFGTGSFDPYLTPLIRGRYRDAPFLTGTNRDHPPFPPEKDHCGSFEIIARGKRKYLCCNIQFLTALKLPVYQTIIARGKRKYLCRNIQFLTALKLPVYQTVVGRPTRAFEKRFKNLAMRQIR